MSTHLIGPLQDEAKRRFAVLETHTVASTLAAEKRATSASNMRSLSHAKHARSDGSGGGGGGDAAGGDGGAMVDAVVFTCGHAFSRRHFFASTIPEFELSLPAGAAAAAAEASAATLSANNRRATLAVTRRLCVGEYNQGAIGIGCPGCVGRALDEAHLQGGRLVDHGAAWQ